MVNTAHPCLTVVRIYLLLAPFLPERYALFCLPSNGSCCCSESPRKPAKAVQKTISSRISEPLLGKRASIRLVGVPLLQDFDEFLLTCGVLAGASILRTSEKWYTLDPCLCPEPCG